MSGASRLRATMHICKGSFFLMFVCTIAACQTQVGSIPLGLAVTSRCDLEALPVPTTVWLLTARTSYGLSPTAATVAVVVATAAVSAIVVVIVMPSIFVVGVFIIVSVFAVGVSVSPTPMAIALLSIDSCLHVQHAINHYLHHGHGIGRNCCCGCDVQWVCRREIVKRRARWVVVLRRLLTVYQPLSPVVVGWWFVRRWRWRSESRASWPMYLCPWVLGGLLRINSWTQSSFG